MRQIGLLLLISAGALLGCSPKERVLDDYVWHPESKEYVRERRREALRAGRTQELTLNYDHPMAEVVGKIGQRAIPFVSHDEGMRWTASIQTPKYEDLADPKVLRIYAKTSDGLTPVSNVHERVPGSWLGRGEDGKFHAIPGPDYDEYPIIK